MTRKGYEPPPEPRVGEFVRCSECGCTIEPDEEYALVTTPKRGVFAPIRAVCLRTSGHRMTTRE